MWSHLAPASPAVVPSNNVLVVLVLLSQVVKQDAIGHRLRKHQKQSKTYSLHSSTLIMYIRSTHTDCIACMMVLIKTLMYLSLQTGGYQGKVFRVLDKPAERRCLKTRT